MDRTKRVIASIVSFVCCIVILVIGGDVAWNANAGGFQWGSAVNSTASAPTAASMAGYV
jgi:hypothetical protein